jgi:ABC-type phosphate transport system permease subunit
MAEALSAMLILFLGQILLAVPTWIYSIFGLEILVRALGIGIFWLSLRLAYTIYKYAKV